MYFEECVESEASLKLSKYVVWIDFEPLHPIYTFWTLKVPYCYQTAAIFVRRLNYCQLKLQDNNIAKCRNLENFKIEPSNYVRLLENFTRF